MVQPEDVKRYIEAGLACEHVEVVGDGQHFQAVVVSPAFRGKSRVQQHQLVYAALGDRMREEIHALSMQTFTPEDWAVAGRRRSARASFSPDCGRILRRVPVTGAMDKLAIEGGVPLAGKPACRARRTRRCRSCAPRCSPPNRCGSPTCRGCATCAR